MPKPKEWLTIKCTINAVGKFILVFYIFRGEKMFDDYIKLRKQKTFMAKQTKAWMASFLFK